MRPSHGFARQLQTHVVGQRFVAHLDEPEPAGQRGIQPGKECLDAERLGMRDAQHGWQRQRLHDRKIGGQQRGDRNRPGRLPGKVLSFAWMRFARPFEYAEEIQPHGRMRIGEYAGDPAAGTHHTYAQFFGEFASQRGFERFAGFHLAARKFPIAGVYLVGRPAGEQDFAVGANEDGGNDFNDGGHGGGAEQNPHCASPAPARVTGPGVSDRKRRAVRQCFIRPGGARPGRFSGCAVAGYFFRPAQSRANCQATRPLRAPRPSAHCSAAASKPPSGDAPSCTAQWRAMAR